MIIHPVPSDEEAAAIAAALEVLNPPSVLLEEAKLPNSDWRFSARSWSVSRGWPNRQR
ncbi:MAG: hypothetical protein GY708_14185 [Actinomycetia bacterium]|nr:hypothetical protein [Actinomycetes bacterium]MCP4957903.1 hypothetical protein [Actinomycetes bacterium]